MFGITEEKGRATKINRQVYTDAMARDTRIYRENERAGRREKKTNYQRRKEDVETDRRENKLGREMRRKTRS